MDSNISIGAFTVPELFPVKLKLKKGFHITQLSSLSPFLLDGCA